MPSALTIQSLFGRTSALIGMVHARALPGSPRASMSIAQICDIAAHEAIVLRDAGFHGAIIENMHDRPYVMNVGPEIVAAMTAVGLAVRDAAPELTLGVQILSLSGRQTIAVAHAIGASFVRIENFAFAHVADEGVMLQAEAGPLLRYRAAIGAEQIAVFADVKKKHASHAITADLTLTEAVRASEFFGADGVIISGRSTGDPTSSADLEEARAATALPILVGSGATPDSLLTLLQNASGVIVGSALKHDGLWNNDLDPDRCRRFSDAFGKAAPP